MKEGEAVIVDEELGVVGKPGQGGVLIFVRALQSAAGSMDDVTANKHVSRHICATAFTASAPVVLPRAYSAPAPELRHPHMED